MDACRTWSFEIRSTRRWNSEPGIWSICSCFGVRTRKRSLLPKFYQSELMERFWVLGVDYTKGHTFADCLASNTRNRPAYGWARRHQDDPRIARDLAIALGDAVLEEREKAIHLLLWAGANPHQPVPSLRWSRDGDEADSEGDSSAVETAVLFGKGSVLPLLKPDPKRDNFDSLLTHVRDPESADHLASVSPPGDWSPAIVNCIREISFDLAGRLGQHDWRARHCLERIVKPHGGVLTAIAPDELRYLRGAILKMRNSYDFRWLIEWLGNPRHCSPAIYAEIVRTPAMQARITPLGIREKRRDTVPLARSTT